MWDETFWSFNILIVKLYLHFVGLSYITIYQSTNMNNLKLKLKMLIFSTDHILIGH